MTLSQSPISVRVLEILEQVAKKCEKPVALHEPTFTSIESEVVTRAIESTFVSSAGEYITKFENEIARITGSKYVIATSSGTAALEVALVASGVNPGTEVIVPTLSFIATANAVSNIGAVPFFVDSESVTLGMCPNKLRELLSSLIYDSKIGSYINPATGREIKAIVPMHTLGHPCQIKLILEISSEFNIPVVEDAAEAFGSYVIGPEAEKKHCGTFGLVGTLSFNGNKIITTGGGGAIITDDEQTAVLARKLSNTAKIPHEWEYAHEMISHNYRMPNLNAALGVAQLTKFDTFLIKKREVANRYSELFTRIDGVHSVLEPAGSSSNYWLSSIRLDTDSIELRNEILNFCTSHKFFVRPLWNLLHSQKMYVNCPSFKIETAVALQSSIICLPSSSHLLD
jgi:perosamine synthetase